MADVVQWHSRRVAASVLVLLYVNRRRRNGKRWNNGKLWLKPYISRNLTLGRLLERVSLYAADETSHRSGQFWTSNSLMNVHLHVRPPFCAWSVTQITWTERVFLLVNSHQHTFANRSHATYEFTNTKKLVKELARIEASSICRQQFANVFADCFRAVPTHQLEFANTSLPTLVCRVKAALRFVRARANDAKLSMTFTANGKNETFAVSLQQCVQ